MANNLLYVSDGDYGKRTGYVAALVQGQSGQVIPLEIRDLANNVVNLTGYTTITGRMDDRRGNVTSIDGTLALDATPSTAPQVNWTVSATDTGTPGVFDIILVLSNGSATLKTLPVGMAIHADPAATVVPGTAMVAVTQAQATLLAVISGLTGLVKMAGGAASAILIKLDATAAPTVNDDSGDGYGIGSIWIDTTNDNAYIATDVTVGAANWEQINGAGGASTWGSITGTLSNQTDLQTALNAKQTSNANLTAIAGLTFAAGNLIKQTGAAAVANLTISSFGESLIDDADASAGRTTLGLGTLATQSGTFSGGGTLATGGFTLTVPATGTAALLATANVFTAAQMVDGTADAIQLRVQGHSTQTSNLQTWENSAGTVVGSLTNGGIFNASSSLSVGSIQFVGFAGADLRHGNGSGWFTQTFYTDSAAKMHLDINGRLGVRVTSSVAGQVDVNQPSTTAAIPVLKLTQADVSEEFIRLVGTSANGVLTQSIVEAADVGVATIAGYVKVYVQDDGNQLTDQSYFMPVYTLA